MSGTLAAPGNGGGRLGRGSPRAAREHPAGGGQAAGARATRVTRDPDGYVLKFRGAELSDETRSLADAGLVPNGALIVLPRRRRPVR